MNFTTKNVSEIVSDDFSAPALDTSVWTAVNPLGDATFTLQGTGTQDALLNITIPGGTAHDAWTVNNAPRLMQSVSNTDFEIITKFQSVMTSKYQEQGIIVQQDNNNYLRFDFTRDATTTEIYAVSFTDGVATKRYNIGITPGNPLYMKINRTGDQWKQSYSYDGTTWIAASSFSYALTVNS